MAQNPPSFRFPFASLGKLPPEAQAAHLATFNALTDIYQAIAQQKENSSSSTTTINETVEGTTGAGGGRTTEGVTSFNGDTGDVIFFPDLFLVNNQTGQTDYTTQDEDNGAFIVLNDASAIAVGLNYTVYANWATWIANYGIGTATLTPALVPSGVTSTITYPGNIAASSMPLPSGFAAFVSFDGQNFWAIAISISSSGSGVTSLNGLTGALALVGGTGITVTPSGSDIDISLGSVGLPSVVDSYSSTAPETTGFTHTFPTLPAGLYRAAVYFTLTTLTGASGTSTVGATVNYTDLVGTIGVSIAAQSLPGPATSTVPSYGTIMFYSTGAAMSMVFNITNTGSIAGTYVVQAITLERLA